MAEVAIPTTLDVTTQLATKVPLSQRGAANGVATLDAGGKIPTAQLPPLAITDVYPVANQAEMLALTAQVGDVAIRADGAGSFMLRAEPATTLANWTLLTTRATTSADISDATSAATPAAVARRDSSGRLAVVAGVAADDVVNLGQLTAFGRDRGAGNTWPSTDLRRGDHFYLTPVNMVGVYTGTGWRLVDVGTVATVAARDALDAANCYPGMQVRVDATRYLYEYQNSVVKWTLPWTSPWGQLTPTVLPSGGIGVGAGYTTAGTTATVFVPKNRRLRVCARSAYYWGGSLITIAWRQVFFSDANATPATAVATSTNTDYRIGGSAQTDLIAPSAEFEFITTAGQNVRAELQHGMGTAGPYALGDISNRWLYLEDAGPTAAPATA